MSAPNHRVSAGSQVLSGQVQLVSLNIFCPLFQLSFLELSPERALKSLSLTSQGHHVGIANSR